MSSENKKVAVIGLGSMGMGIAQSLLRAGFEVIGCDVNADALARFRQAGGDTVSAPDDIAADCQILVSVVVSDAQAQDVLFGPNGVAAKLPPGALFIACSTVPPDFAVRTAERLASWGVLYLDAPISGGAAKAAEGKLSIMASGSAQAFAKAQDVTAAIAQKVYKIGDQAGQGSSMKMINQLLAGVHIAAAAEAMALATKVGLDAHMVYEVISNSAGGSWMFENRVPHILEGNYKPRSAVSIFLKDLGIVLSTANSQRFPVPLAATAHQLFTMAASAGMGNWDDAAVAKVYEKLSDITLPQKETSGA
jgi:L-threonate 2-dehydrogenase